MVDIENHFVKHRKKYIESVENADKELYRSIRKELDKNLKGVVLDIGNGGVLNYDVKRLKKVIALDLIFNSVKKISKNKKIKYIGGDACNLDKIKTDSCDRVVMQFLLHHITKRNKRKTDIAIEKSLKEANRVLKKGGELVIIEIIAGKLTEKLEDMFYNVTSFFLSIISKPMVKFYSKNKLYNLLNKVGFRKIFTKLINIGKYIDPLGGILPGVIKLPAALYPFKCKMIRAVK